MHLTMTPKDDALKQPALPMRLYRGNTRDQHGHCSHSDSTLKEPVDSPEHHICRFLYPVCLEYKDLAWFECFFVT